MVCGRFTAFNRQLTVPLPCIWRLFYADNFSYTLRTSTESAQLLPLIFLSSCIRFERSLLQPILLRLVRGVWRCSRCYLWSLLQLWQSSIYRGQTQRASAQSMDASYQVREVWQYSYKGAHAVESTTSSNRLLLTKAGLPFIGNVHELSDKNSWMKFREWGEKFGPIYQVNLAGSNHVWITRDKIAKELLGDRRDIYCDRPRIHALEQDSRDSGQYLPVMSKNGKHTG